MSLFKKEMPEEPEEKEFKVWIRMDNGYKVSAGGFTEKEEAKKELERIKQTKGKYFSSKCGRLIVEMKKITYAIVIEV